MIETQPETQPEQPELAEQSETQPELVDAPADVDDNVATGYAVYDRTLGRYVGGVSTDKPSAAAARKLVGEGHQHKVVRV